MDDAIFSGRHDNMDNSESAVDSVTKLKEYLISAIREWSRILVGKDKSRENIWLPVHSPYWWLHTYPPWRNPTGKKKDTLEELKIKYNILQGKLLDEKRFPKQWLEQTDLYQNGRYQDLFLLTRLIKVAEELREKEQELKEIVAETFNISNFSTASVVECLVQSGVSIQSEVKKLQEKLGSKSILSNDSINLSVEKSNNDSSVLNYRENNKETVLQCSKTIDINTTHFSLSTKALQAYCKHTTNIPIPHSPLSTITLNTQSSHASNTLVSTTLQKQSPHTTTTLQKQSPHTTTTVQKHSPHKTTTLQKKSPHTTTNLQKQSPHTTIRLQKHSPHTTTTLQKQSPHTTTTQQKQSPYTTTTQQKQSPHTTTTTPPTYYKTSHKRAITETHTDIPPKIPKCNSHITLKLLTLHHNNPENNFISNPVEITKADLLLDIPEADADVDSTSTNSDKHSTLSPDEGISSVGFTSESDSSPIEDPPKITLHLNNNQYTQEQLAFFEEDGTKYLLKYV